MVPNYWRGCSVRQEALSGARRGEKEGCWMLLSAADAPSTSSGGVEG